MSKRFLSLAAALALTATTYAPARAAVEAAAGWYVYAIPTPGSVQGAVVRSGNSIFVGQGVFPPPANNQTVIRLDSGVPTTIATGFNSLGGFALAGDGTLYVVDNGGTVSGATTGDTVFAIPSALTRTTPVTAVGAEVVPAGSIPAAQDVAIDGTDLIVSDANGPGAGRVLRVSGGVATPIITGLDYTAGVTVNGTQLLVGNSNFPSPATLYEYTTAGVFVTTTASGLSGNYAHDLDNDGNILVTGGFGAMGSNVIAIAPGGGITERAWGFGFSSELFHDEDRNETLVLDFGVSEVTAICRDSNANDICDADEPPPTTTTTTTSSTTTTLPGLCDGVAIAKPKAQISKAAAPAGDEGFKLGGEITIPTTPPIDPVTNGARVVIEDVDSTVLDVTIPAGAYDKGTKTGWKVNGAGTSVTFSSKVGVSGITKVGVKAGKTSGLYKLKVVGKSMSLPVTSGDLPLTITFVLDPDGQCGVADFSGLEPTCEFNSAGKTLKCK